MKKINLAGLDKPVVSVIRKVGQLADMEGLPVYIVGGIVRDYYLKRKNFDLDFVAEGNALKLAQGLGKQEESKVVKYPQFLTATVLLKDNFNVDFATARKERYPRPGSLPEVLAGTIQDDLFRRDFTINAMAVRINSNFIGELADFYHGFRDLEERKVRVLHKKSFLDDPTRILRAVRFEQRLGFSIEPSTFLLLKAALKKNALSSVQPVRLFEEFKKILKEPNPIKYLGRLEEIRALTFLGEKFKPNYRRLELLERNLKTVSLEKYQLSESIWFLRFMAICEGNLNARLSRLLEGFQLNHIEQKSILELKKIPDITRGLQQTQGRPSKVYSLLNPLSGKFRLFLRFSIASVEMHKQVEDYLTKYQHTVLSVNGNDLKKLGCPPGKGMGDVLKELLANKIDGKIRSKEDELNLAKHIMKHSHNKR